MADVGLVVVFAEGGVQDPVAAVLDAPMLPDVALKRGRGFVEAADVVTHFPADFVAVELGRLRFHVNQAAEIAPFPADPGIHPVEAMVDRDASRDDAAVGFFDPLVVTPTLAVLEIEIADGEVELILCFFVKVLLVAFEGEEVGEGLGAGNTIGHFNPFAQPVGLEVAEVLNVGKAVHTAKHDADGHEEHLAEMMQFVAADARIIDDRE
jgi:hypothetical protein